MTRAITGFILGVMVLAFSLPLYAEAEPSLPFSEFKKIISPRSSLIPLPGGKESLVLAMLSDDAYAMVYRLDHSTKAFTREYDAGRNISSLFRDPLLRRLYVLMDQNGDENYGLYEYVSDAKKEDRLRPIFVKDGFKISLADFSSNGETLYLRSNYEGKNIFSIYAFDLATRKLRRLTDGKTSWDGAEANSDGKRLVLTQSVGNNETRLSLLEVSSRKVKQLFAKSATNFNVGFMHPTEPTTLYLNSNDGRDRMGCAKVDTLKPESWEWVRVDDQKDITCSYSRGSRLTFVSEEYAGRVRVRILDSVFGKELPSPFPEQAIVSQITRLPGESFAYARILSSNSPGDFYRFDLSKGKTAELVPVSALNQSKIPNKDFAKSYDINFKSFDGLDIHGIIYAKEEWLKSTTRHPVIVWPHGGPDGLEMHVYNPLFQFWVMNGFVVFAPNFRGSTGYGKKFETLNDKDWGGGHIKDLIWGKRAAEKLSYVDPNRIFIVGASFGGFSTLSAITQYPKEFRGAVAIVALANLFTFFKSIPQDPQWQNEFRTEMGDPVKDETLFKERSPYFFADRIQIPLQIYQAENDVRTVKAEMDSFVEKLKGYKIPVTYQILRDEGHSPTRAETWQTVMQGSVDFLKNIK